MADTGMGRYASLTGILAAVMVVVAALISGETPSADDSASSIISFWRDNDAKEFWTAIMLAWSAVPLVFFAGCLRSVLRAGEGASGGWSSVAFGGLVIFAVGLFVNAGVQFTLADVADSDKVGPGTILSLNALNNTMWMPLVGGLSIALLGFAIATMRQKLFPAWLRWLALVLGIVCVTPGWLHRPDAERDLVRGGLDRHVPGLGGQAIGSPPPAAPAATG